MEKKYIRKGLYLTFHDVDPAAGVSRKILQQVESFNNNGVDISLLSYRSVNGIRTAFLDNQEISRMYRGLKCVVREIQLYPIIVNYIQDNHIDFLFIRYTQRLDYFYLRFLKKCKKANCVLLLEIPTYPYDGEFSSQSLLHKVQIYVERFFRRYLKNSIDWIVTTSEFDSILGVNTIRISNAVDPRAIRLRTREEASKGVFTMISVANLSFWHGLDRLIKGIANYKMQLSQPVRLIIVGGGNEGEINIIKSLVEEYRVQDYVKYLGPKHGKELDELYDLADMGVGCLACHRKNIVEVKSLKNVEYAMRGIPFFYSELNTDFDNKKYVLKVPADDTDINVMDILSFYHSLNITPNEIRDSVSDLTWDRQIEKIIKVAL